jgi:hypothetical protein
MSVNHHWYCIKERTIPFHELTTHLHRHRDSGRRMVEDQTIIKGNITRIMSVNHHWYCIKERTIPFHELTTHLHRHRDSGRRMVEDQTIIKGNITRTMSVRHQWEFYRVLVWRRITRPRKGTRDGTTLSSSFQVPLSVNVCYAMGPHTPDNVTTILTSWITIRFIFSSNDI